MIAKLGSRNNRAPLAALVALSVLPLACGAEHKQAAGPQPSAAGLSLRLEVARSHAEPVLRLYLVNGQDEPRQFFVSDKLNAIHLAIVDGRGDAVSPGQDARSVADFDSAAPTPEVRELAAHSEVQLREERFFVPSKVLGSTYRFAWRPFFYRPFEPGTYSFRAVWPSSRGFSGELTSNEVVVVLPTP